MFIPSVKDEQSSLDFFLAYTVLFSQNMIYSVSKLNKNIRFGIFTMNIDIKQKYLAYH